MAHTCRGAYGHRTSGLLGRFPVYVRKWRLLEFVPADCLGELGCGSGVDAKGGHRPN